MGRFRLFAFQVRNNHPEREDLYRMIAKAVLWILELAFSVAAWYIIGDCSISILSANYNGETPCLISN
jgi:hypothetical protein